jgi:hypothetical protein
MPFCPLCKAEYAAGVKRCLECECDLMEDLSEEEGLDEEGEWVLLYSTTNRVYAEFLKETLEESNIRAIIRSSGSFLEHGLGYVSKGQTGYKIYVQEEHYEESSAIKDQTVGNL